ncbi:MAG: helix-turn-helix domain-containing protein, partial [Bacteroidales bacterium]
MNDYFTLHDNKNICCGISKKATILNGFCIDKLAENNYLLKDMPFQANIFAIVLCTQGETNILVNEKDYNVKKGTMIIVIPNNIISTKTNKTEISGYYFASSTEFINQIRIETENVIPILMQFFNNPVINLNDDEFELIKKYFELLYNEDNSVHTTHRSNICAGIMTSFIYKISDLLTCRQNENRENNNKSGVKLFRAFINLVMKKYQKHREVNWYAEQLCVTPKYLSTVVKDISKQRASKWIGSCVIMEAKSLLKYSDKTIQEISYQLNFPNPSFFGAYFRKYGGMTP